MIQLSRSCFSLSMCHVPTFAMLTTQQERIRDFENGGSTSIKYTIKCSRGGLWGGGVATENFDIERCEIRHSNNANAIFLPTFMNNMNHTFIKMNSLRILFVFFPTEHMHFSFSKGVPGNFDIERCKPPLMHSTMGLLTRYFLSTFMNHFFLKCISKFFVLFQISNITDFQKGSPDPLDPLVS